MSKLQPREALLDSAASLHPLHERDLSWADLRGLRAILYSRISALIQKKGSGLARQDEYTETIVAECELTVDQRLSDEGKSAIKLRHITDGELGALFKLIDDGTVSPADPVLFVVEDIDRVVRSGNVQAGPILHKLIVEGGMILVLARERLIFNRAYIDGIGGVILSVLITRAYQDGKRIVSKAVGAHKAKRKLLEDNKVPDFAGRRPGWIVRVGPGIYELHEVHAATVAYIFHLCVVEGLTARAIARRLNAEGVPVLGDIAKKGRIYNEWRSQGVLKLLRNHAVRGWVQPHHMVKGKRSPVGEARKVYPEAVKDEVFWAAQEALDGRRLVRGRRGPQVANLFTGRLKCGCCIDPVTGKGAAMRVDASGEKYRPGRTRMFQCSRHIEAGKCDHATRYPVPLWEHTIVEAVLAHSEIAREPEQRDPAATQRIALDAQIAQLEKRIAAIEPEIADSKAMKDRWKGWCADLDQFTAQRSELMTVAVKAETEGVRRQERSRFLREAVAPALGARDPGARAKLRHLLASVDFEVTFTNGVVELRVEDWQGVILPE